jgi:hypothetical protein
VQDAGRQLRVELGPVQDLRLPEGNPATLYLPNRYAAEVLADRRSRIPALWRLDETTVLAADLGYDIRLPAGGGPPVLDGGSAAQLADYRLVRLYADDYSGFAAAAFEARTERGLAPHRIYAIAGTHVFEHRDFRSWASGLTSGRAQFTSTAALELIADAATYARHPRGGEVVLTRQSQSGLVAQGVATCCRPCWTRKPGLTAWRTSSPGDDGRAGGDPAHNRGGARGWRARQRT